MERSDAFQIARLLDEVVRGRQGAALFAGEIPTNVCLLWVEEFMRTVDAELATKAVAALFTDMTDVPTPAGYREMVRKLKRDIRMARFAVEKEAALGVPAWAVGWLVARERNDHRVWAEQKPGYDELQEANPRYRAYVWGEQEQLPQDVRDGYMEKAANLSPDEVAALLRAVTAGDA